MAGVKGMKGGGGARPGAGRKSKKRDASVSTNPARIDDVDMLQLLQDVALGKVEASTLQVRAAIAAVQYTHTKRHDGGKKEERDAAAKKVAGGKFAAGAPPLKLVNR